MVLCQSFFVAGSCKKDFVAFDKGGCIGISHDTYSDGRDKSSGENACQKLNSDSVLMGGDEYCGANAAGRKALLKV